MRVKRRSLWALPVIVGSVMIIAALVLSVCWQMSIRAAPKKYERLITAVSEQIPQPYSAAPEARSDNSMPVLSVEENDLIGVLDMPGINVKLPISAEWDRKMQLPCVHSGSIYDGSMVIDATTQTGQFEGYRSINVGDAVSFTDMTGARYAFKVTNIVHTDDRDEYVKGESTKLVIAIKNLYAFEHVMIECDNN